MDKDTRNSIERATQRARKLLEEDFREQLEGVFDVHRDGTVAAKAGAHLSARQAFQRERIIAAIDHKRAAGMTAADAVHDYVRDAAFTTLNRFVALKMLEARELVQECITKGEQSAGYREFCGLAAGLPLLPDSAGYRLYVESLFDELSTEVKVLFDRRDPSSVISPKRTTFEQLLDILNGSDLGQVWGEDETIGWVYQFFNGQDERRKMREESLAPRNSRELAVRNQFFTPRYVVQFLTDNTLGRIWYEMRGTKTALAERCEYMVRKPGVEIPISPRAKKDPRDMCVLDPACGSGHFLLYAFDLLLAIYEEAYADPGSPRSESSGKTLAEDYPTLDALRKAMPGLVLAHNLHGVDIDPRCAQIAQLAMWMRAQKAYRDFGISRSDRAQIRRSNIVVAEPLVADNQVAKEFVSKLDIELGRVFTSLVETLSMAGDLGLLLRAEQLVVRQRKRGQTGDLFAPPEERIRAALDRFIREEASGTSTRRRLFADDAAHGLALLGIAEKRFDAILMNPPFGACATTSKAVFDSQYARSKIDLYAAFVERGIELLASGGLVGAITSRTGFFLPTFQSWRERNFLEVAAPVAVADLGYGVLDSALVEVAAYCLEQERRSDAPAVFLRCVDSAEKSEELLALCKDDCSQVGRFIISPASFRDIPGSPLSYWVSDRIRSIFSRGDWKATERFRAKNGLGTLGDFRFVRLATEIAPLRAPGKFFPMCNGGRHSPFYQDIAACVHWMNDGREVKAHIEHTYRGGHWSRSARAVDYYFRPGITWPVRGVRFSSQAVPEGCVFSVAGKMGFVSEINLPAFFALSNSTIFAFLVRVQSDAVRIQFQGGLIQGVPIPPLAGDRRKVLGQLGEKAWQLCRTTDTCTETSHAFLLPALVQVSGETLEVRTEQWREHLKSISLEIARIQAQIDDECFALYSISDSDRDLIVRMMERESARVEGAEESDGAGSEEGTDEVGGLRDAADGADEVVDGLSDAADGDALATQLVSWAVGVSVGRFAVRPDKARQPGPFERLQPRCPGMPHSDVASGKETTVAFIVDDLGDDRDIVAAIRRVFAATFGTEGEEFFSGVADLLDDDGDLRRWLAKKFFPLHIKMYSRSRRKAPVYWQLATPSASYSVWLYIHALSKDTLFRVQNDYVAPKLAHEERRFESLSNELRDGATAAQRKQLAAQEAVVEELRAFLAEVKRVAPLWNPNLDDGVIINFAPLWRLVPQNKSWQKELKSTWDALCEGKYDWAHLAMHLWPERVVPKCAKDRSLAIAHGLEDVFWIEGTDGKWPPRKAPTQSVDELVKERTSTAVKSSLKSLLEAPTANGTATKPKKTPRKGSAHA